MTGGRGYHVKLGHINQSTAGHVTQTLRFVILNNTADLTLELLLAHWFLFLIHHPPSNFNQVINVKLKPLRLAPLLRDEVSSCSYVSALMEALEVWAFCIPSSPNWMLISLMCWPPTLTQVHFSFQNGGSSWKKHLWDNLSEIPYFSI